MRWTTTTTTARQSESDELATLRAKGVLGPEFETPADLPAHLRMREPASTAEDVDVAARRFARVFAANGVAVSLKRQAPFKYVLEPQPTSHRATAAKAGAHAARAPQAKIVVLKLEGHRLVVHVGGANRSRAEKDTDAAMSDPRVPDLERATTDLVLGDGHRISDP